MRTFRGRWPAAGDTGQGADEGLYEAKKAGGQQLAEGRTIQWPAFASVPAEIEVKSVVEKE